MSITYSGVYWCTKFKERREVIENNPCPCCPLSFKINFDIQKVGENVQTNYHLSICTVANINKETIQQTLHSKCAKTLH